MAKKAGTLEILVTAATKQFERGMGRVRKELGSTKAAANTFRNSLVGVASVAAAATAATVALGKLTLAGGKYIAVQEAFNRNAGGGAVALAKLQRASRGVISNYELMVGFNRALALGTAKTAEEFGTLVQVADKLGRTMGLDATFALEKLNAGIGRQSRLLLDDLGIKLTVTEANKLYAKSLNTTVEALTDVQKAEAFRIEAMRQANALIESSGDLSETAADQVGRAATAFINLKDAVASMVAEAPLVMWFFRQVQDAATELNTLSDMRRFGVSAAGLGQLQSAEGIQTLSLATAAYKREVALLTEAYTNYNRTGKINEEWLADQIAFVNALAKRQRELAAATERAAVAAEDQAKATAATNRELAKQARLARLAGMSMGGTSRGRGPLESMVGGIYMPPVTPQAQNLNRTAGGGGSFLGGLRDQLSGSFDIKGIVSNMLGGVLSGGLSSLIGGIGSLLGDVFSGGPDAVVIEQQRLRESLERNRATLEQNTEALAAKLGGVAGNITGQAPGAIRKALENLRFKNQLGVPVDFMTELERTLSAVGLSLEDLRSVAETLGLEWEETVASLTQLGEAIDKLALEQFKSFSGAFGLMQQEFDLLDITDPMEQFNRSIELVAGLVSSDLADVLRTLDPDTIDEFISSFLDSLRAGTLDRATLGELSPDEFLKFLGFAEGALDRFATETERATSAIRNSPMGFKGALMRFASADFAIKTVKTGNDGGGGGFGGFDWGLRPGATEQSASVIVQELNVYGVQSGSELWATLQEEARRRGGSGGGTSFALGRA